MSRSEKIDGFIHEFIQSIAEEPDVVFETFRDGETPWARPQKRAVLRDARLSFGARGLYALLSDYPGNWSFNKAQILGMTPEGAWALDSKLAELQKVGALSIEKNKLDDAQARKINARALEEARRLRALEVPEKKIREVLIEKKLLSSKGRSFRAGLFRGWKWTLFHPDTWAIEHDLNGKPKIKESASECGFHRNESFPSSEKTGAEFPTHLRGSEPKDLQDPYGSSTHPARSTGTTPPAVASGGESVDQVQQDDEIQGNDEGQTPEALQQPVRRAGENNSPFPDRLMPLWNAIISKVPKSRHPMLKKLVASVRLSNRQPLSPRDWEVMFEKLFAADDQVAFLKGIQKRGGWDPRSIADLARPGETYRQVRQRISLREGQTQTPPVVPLQLAQEEQEEIASPSSKEDPRRSDLRQLEEKLKDQLWMLENIEGNMSTVSAKARLGLEEQADKIRQQAAITESLVRELRRDLGLGFT